jgi:UDP-N-acetylmuramate: L-alanyl-gamma-D-glutamyl-meso-diaminopimelate ligase
MKTIHFISLAESNFSLIIASIKMGYDISLSEEIISDSLREKLSKNNLIVEDGWFPDRITSKIDLIVVDSKLKSNNSELLKAKSIGIKIFSIVEFINKITERKTKVVVYGINGKKTLISVIMHVLGFHNIDFDYYISDKYQKNKSKVHLTKNNDFILIEVSENIFGYMISDSNFNFFKPHIAVITSYFSRKMNKEIHNKKFRKNYLSFINNISPGGNLIFNKNDIEINGLIEDSSNVIKTVKLLKPSTIIIGDSVNLETDEGLYPLKIKDDFSLLNISFSIWVCQLLGIYHSDFYDAIVSYKDS